MLNSTMRQRFDLVPIQGKKRIKAQIFEHFKICKHVLRAFIVSLGISNTIRAYKLVKREDSNVHIMQAAIEDFPKVCEK